MRTELVSEPGDPARPNEDFAALAVPAAGQGGVLVVLDGVTPPRGPTGCVHTVPWYTARLGGALTELTASRRDVPLAEALSLAIDRTATSHSQTCDLSHPRTPQATVALARWDERHVDHLVLSDAALLLESPDGTVTPVLDDRLARLPRALLVSDEVADARARNKEGGFFTAAADPSVAARAVTGRVARADVHSLLGLTDGAGRWVETFHEGDWADLPAYVRKAGPGGLVRRVRELETSDAEARMFLGRAKTHDDATAVYVEP
ncbi:protein phosphatase 2C domain-containing protein [Streptomyces roseirectus]|uniref:Protein phosphatase 2C domain-containing protein n=1 Tax=Streptomyces roseirectus TaxID=2768066 RepID=A0A7H0IBT0_9ACTN|nr:protein phosphatase 2C domain-containing protein [Streptomyces roseirectus]QNP70246.1 protein phosphatase 2C domain-containing protein [Streptomyces roseirectus]